MIDHSQYKEDSIQGRYINLDDLQFCFSKLSVPLIRIGSSVNQSHLYAFQLGKGPIKVLLWSQMHGNESTTTKAVWDMVNFLQSNDPLAHIILKECSLMVVPMLNPDGANVYTRENINCVDLNRDAKDLSQPESVALRKLFESFQPDYCFNLHDQRTLFSAGNTDKPATVSFLSPSSNKEREITTAREIAMKLIAGMNAMLQKHIPCQVGRYDDGFNDNCVGDTFQMLGVPTVLFESGHYPDDYDREVTRKYIFLSMLEALKTISNQEIDKFNVGDYFSIPGNRKLFFDVIIENATLLNPTISPDDRVGIRYKEVLKDNTVIFEPQIAEIGILKGFYGHRTIECIDTKGLGFASSDSDIQDLLLKTKK
ncbi:MAG: DUF2817 domain-containing protein [Algicola sp.]|nr:DUF2817 domain-containing protein [Algicola sp.]